MTTPVVTMKQLLEAGVHFGHQTRRWNPRMRRYIHSERNGIYIIDLQKTLSCIENSYGFVRDLVAGGGTVMFVGTKKQAQDSVRDFANACGMPYINNRWLGGMLTNFNTISKRVGKMRDYQRMQHSGDFEGMPKKEALRYSRELEKLERNLLGMVNLSRLPDAVFVIDTNKEHIAVTEARKLGIPVVAIVDTNCDPDIINHVIPGNDDAIRSASLMCRVIHDAVIEGRHIAQARGNGGPVAMMTPEREAEKAQAQAEARKLAQEEARRRAARLAAEAEKAQTPAEAPAAEAPAPAEAPSDAPSPSDTATATEEQS